MVVSTQLQAFVDINTLLRTVMCFEMYKSINCIVCIVCIMSIKYLLTQMLFNNRVMKSYQLNQFIDSTQHQNKSVEFLINYELCLVIEWLNINSLSLNNI